MESRIVKSIYGKINSKNTKERLSYIINEMTDLTDHTSPIENITSQIHDVILQAAERCTNKIQLSERSIPVLFNKLYDASFYPEIWSTRVIVPIYKKGDCKQPANYRGITLTSTMSKLFTYILNQILSSWFEQSGAASQAQFAYKKKNSTVDAVFVLSSLIFYSLKKSNIFCAFIDFTKTFDSIDRNLLYAKLMGYKISVKMLKMIVNIYSKVKNKVRTEGVSTGTFNPWMGLMQ